jgi:hypothetical protein
MSSTLRTVANDSLLTPEQEASVRAAYAADIALWESLNA